MSYAVRSNWRKGAAEAFCKTLHVQGELPYQIIARSASDTQLWLVVSVIVTPNAVRQSSRRAWSCHTTSMTLHTLLTRSPGGEEHMLYHLPICVVLMALILEHISEIHALPKHSTFPNWHHLFKLLPKATNIIMSSSGNFQVVSILIFILLHLYKGTLAAAAPHHPRNNDQDCKCMPGDACWPSTEDWSALNRSLGGRLVATVPIGSPCHDPTYVEAECLALKNQWFRPDVQ